MAAHSGACERLPLTYMCPGRSYTGYGNATTCNRTGWSASNCQNDPQFEEKVRDIVGLYLDPPDRALVLCVDEKSQIQALDIAEAFDAEANLLSVSIQILWSQAVLVFE